MGKRKGPQSVATARQFGRSVAERRRKLGLTQDGTADRAGLHRTEIALIEQGGRLPRLDTIVKLGGALGVEPCELMRGLAWKLEGLKEGSK
ncbi:MAG TPA: helix-turn-helix transcriptional regulator [Solirubrobacterales bacterium]|nr:helix-turn-helix transcriptional regulator [Solirubrobacterales bacterium]